MGETNSFREILTNRNSFMCTVELVPGRGSRGKCHDRLLGFAELAAAGELVHALSITDNPGGHPALAPEVIGSEIHRLGIEPIIHFTCKDKNRNEIESVLYALDRTGIHNILAMTGDYPLYGFQGKAKPVYDLDSVQLLRFIGRMNNGLPIDDRAPGGGVSVPATSFVKGCVVSPFKKLESETMCQYLKLLKKVREGADFIITQVGYDVRKFDELLKFMHLNGINIPVFGNVYVLKLPVARMMNRNGIPGCVVNDKLLREIENESQAPDKGKSAAIERAAKLVAILKGIGYSGVHIGGMNLAYEDVEQIIGKSEDYAADWQSLVPEFDYSIPDGFYLFKKDKLTGLNTAIPEEKTKVSGWNPGYKLMKLVHGTIFSKDAPFYKPACTIVKVAENTRLESILTKLEYCIKTITSGCRCCGDCTLTEIAYLCPQTQCPKFQLNGQCGGSSGGWCEVFPGKRKCIYVRAYNRLKPSGKEETLNNGYICPRDWALDETSSWTNYFMGRDHTRKDFDL